MTTDAARKFRIDFVNAAEDVPRLARAYGRACDGEFAMVLRPAEERGVLVLMRKQDGARLWRAPSAPTDTSDAPAMPAWPIAAADAVTLVKTEQKAVPKAGPITLRGNWRGYLHCDSGQPRVELFRKLAAYGTLRIVSAPGVGWTWTVERTEKWFSKPGSDTGTAATLLKAIEGGLARAMGLLGEVCSVRDSRRRAALDTAYAVEHPIRPAREGKDPTGRLQPREPRKKPPTSGGWTHYAHDDEAPESDPIERPSRAVLARVKGGNLQHDPGTGTFLGRTIEPFHGFAVGSLIFREPEDNAAFYLHAPVEEAAPKARGTRAAATEVAVPARRRATRAASMQPRAPAAPMGGGEVDAAKDKALLDAFSQAIAAAMQ
jgi:hypothetical protein